MVGGSAPRYAPSDPSLPPQWKALVDGNTGYIYYWNTETNITQYEKPLLPSGGNTIPPGPPPAPPPNSARPPKLATLPSINSPVRTSEKRSSSSSKNGATPPPPSGGTISNNASEEGMICSPPRHVSGLERRYPDTDRRYQDPERRYPSGGISDSERRYLSGGISDSDRRYPSGASKPDHHRADISDHHRTNRPHMSETHGRSSEAYGRNLSEHHGRHMHDPHATSGSANALRSGHAMSESALRPSPRSIPGGSTHLNAVDSSWGGTDSSRHAHGLPVGPRRSASSSRNDRDGRGNMGSLTKLAPLLPGPHGQQDGMRVMHYDQARPTVSSHLDGPLPGAPIGSLKRSASEYPISAPDARKRPRIQEPFVVSDVQTYRMHHEITVVGDNVPPPFMTFDSGKFPPELHRELCAAGFTAPTPIQAQSWPIALQNRDIVAIAKTGSGKTLGYLLPAFLHLRQTKANSRAGPIVLVLAPTRELATQIQDEAVKFGRSSRISTTCVYGGAPKGPQLRDLERGADIVIATPGRLNDFLEMKKISLRQVAYLVLDEADRMLDMGFEPQIRKIVKEVPSSRQTLMFTATWPREVRKIAADLLVHPVQVNIGNSDELTANKAITQCVEIVQPYEKLRRLEQILQSQEPGSKVIIFCATKKMCDQLARKLQGFRAASIHGDKSQTERDYVLSQFKSGRSPILVATDVAARGLDVKDIRVVINYDFPTGVEDYVHRIGRTGRAGATGVAFTFFSEQDSKHARELVKILEGAEQKVPPELRHFSARSFQSRGRGWQTDALDDRGPEHRPIDIGGRDGGMRVGPRDGGLLFDGSGGLNYPDGARDRSMSRIGSDRVGDIVGREGRTSSRAEDAGGRVPYDTRDEIMPTREGDFHGGIGTRVGGMSGTREGSFKRSDGGHKDGWGEHTSADGWGAVGGGGLREAGFRSSEGGHKDGWSEGHPRDDGWNAGTDVGTRVGGPSRLREAGFISSEGGRKDGRGEHPHADGWGVDKRADTREETFKSSEGIHKDGWGERPHDGWGADTRVGTRGGFKSTETIRKDRHDEHPHDDGWGASTRAGTREGGFKNSEGSRKGRPGDHPHDHEWGVRTLAGGISDSREGGFKSVGSGREDGWGPVHTRFGGMPDTREGAFKSLGGYKDGRGEHHPREDRWGISNRGSGISDPRREGFKNMDDRHEDGRGERPHREGWGVSSRVSEVSGNRERDFKSLPSGHKDARSERPHDRWGVSPRVGGSREGAFRSSEGGNKDGRGERLHDDGWGPSTADGDGDGWGNADGRHAGRDDSKYSDSPSGSRISGVPYGRQSERGRIFDRLGDRKTFPDKSGHRERSTDDRVHGGDIPIKSSVAKEDIVMGSRSRGHSPNKGWTVNHTHGRSRSPNKGWEKGHSGRSRSPHNNNQQIDDLKKPTQSGQKRLQTRSPSPRSFNAPRESSSKVLNPANKHSIEDDEEHKDGHHMILPNESEKFLAKSKDSKIQPSENHVMDPLETGADKVTSSDQTINTEQDAPKENKNQFVSDEPGAKSINGISRKHEATDSNVDINVFELEQNIMVIETGRIEGSTVKNHILIHDSLPAEQVTKKNIVDEISAAEEHISKSNLSGNADVTTGDAVQEIDTVVSSPEEGLIEG